LGAFLERNNKTDHLYSDEISLSSETEFSEYITLNLRKIEDHRKNFNIPVICISGAEGKTTTKRMLSVILGSVGNTLETPLDCSTTSGVSSTVLKMNKSHDFVILELGILNPKQFEDAVRISQPTIAAITNIGEAHLADLGDKYFIANTNLELIRRLRPDGFAVLNMDDELVSGMEKISPTSRVIKFGLNTNAHFSASKIKFMGPAGTQFEINNSYKFHLKIYGSASIYNALAAISVARVLDIDFNSIKNSLEQKFKLLEHRGNLINFEDVNILDHSYDATINSIHKSCESLAQFRNYSKKLILVIGHIANLGTKSQNIHHNLGYYISALPIDTIITMGAEARWISDGIRKINHTKKQFEGCVEIDELVEKILHHLEPQSTVLFIGSKTIGLGQAIDKLSSILKSPLYSSSQNS
jgi:UDP-N-acetylmuramoyl-tripeptide--D-alanyl-D-alanine ligase